MSARGPVAVVARIPFIVTHRDAHNTRMSVVGNGMDVFRNKFGVYYFVLSMTGLWPYDRSLLAKIQRTVFALVTLCCIGIQISTLRMVDTSVYNIVMMMSYGCPMLLYVLRYLGFVVNFPVIKCVFENIENDFVALKNPAELEMLTKQTIDARRVILALVVLMCAGITMIVVTLLVPTILESKLQTYFLNFFGFMYKEKTLETDYVCFQIVFVSTIGLLSLACTEASLAVFSSYLCGLFEIARYICCLREWYVLDLSRFSCDFI
ncbi:uncharacterized protein LOC144470268 [Augochlora pura]